MDRHRETLHRRQVACLYQPLINKQGKGIETAIWHSRMIVPPTVAERTRKMPGYNYLPLYSKNLRLPQTQAKAFLARAGQDIS